MRVDSSSLIAGALVCGDRGLGVLGSAIPSTGGSGAGYAYNDLSLPTDNTKEICGRITSWPSAGTLYAYEDTSFEFSGAPDGPYSFNYQLYVDGVAVGAPATVSLQVGNATAQIAVTADDAVFSGGSSVSGSPAVAQFFATLDGVTFAGGATGITATIGRPSSDISNTGWTPSTGSDLFAMLDEVSPDDADYISTATLGAVCKMALNATQYPGGAAQQLSLRASSATGNGLSVTIKDGATTIATRTLSLTPTYDLHTITLTSGEIAAITSGNLTVEMTSI